MEDRRSHYVQEVVDFSSQYGSDTSISYTMPNIAGFCNIFPNYGDFTQAAVFRTYGPWWKMAPSATKRLFRVPQTFRSLDFVELVYARKVFPRGVCIFETYNPGAVVRVLACDVSPLDASFSTSKPRWFVLWEGPPEIRPPMSRDFCPPIKQDCPFPTDLIRIEFNHEHVNYYTEIDAVKLSGTITSSVDGPEISDINYLLNRDSDLSAAVYRSNYNTPLHRSYYFPEIPDNSNSRPSFNDIVEANREAEGLVSNDSRFCALDEADMETDGNPLSSSGCCLSSNGVDIITGSGTDNEGELDNANRIGRCTTNGIEAGITNGIDIHIDAASEISYCPICQDVSFASAENFAACEAVKACDECKVKRLSSETSANTERYSSSNEIICTLLNAVPNSLSNKSVNTLSNSELNTLSSTAVNAFSDAALNGLPNTTADTLTYSASSEVHSPVANKVSCTAGSELYNAAAVEDFSTKTMQAYFSGLLNSNVSLSKNHTENANLKDGNKLMDYPNGAQSYVSSFKYPNGYFDKLPVEIIQLILSFLDLATLCRLSSVCRLFNHHCSDPVQFMEVDLQPYWHRISDSSLVDLETRCIRAQKLSLSWCGGYGLISSKAATRFIKNCSEGLTCLRLACCRFVDDAMLNAITIGCCHLTELDLQCCRRICNTAFIKISSLVNLQRLNLYRTNVDAVSLLSITRSCSKLEHLNLGACTAILEYNDVAASIGDNCRNLISLDLWRAKGLTDIGLRAIAVGCSKLQELDLGWCPDLKSSTGCFIHLAKSCLHLKKLFLTANRTVCDEDLEAISTHLTELEQLDILGIREVHTAVLHRVLERCRYLKFFDVSFCEAADVESVKQWQLCYPHCDIKRSFQAERSRKFVHSWYS